MPTYVRSDRKAQYEKKMRDIEEYMMGEPEIIPVDAFGARTDYVKDNANPSKNLQKAQGDIRRRFDMDLPVQPNDVEGGKI